MKEKTKAAVKAATDDILKTLDNTVLNPGVVAAIKKRMEELDATIEALEPPEEASAEASN